MHSLHSPLPPLLAFNLHTSWWSPSTLRSNQPPPFQAVHLHPILMIGQPPTLSHHPTCLAACVIMSFQPHFRYFAFFSIFWHPSGRILTCYLGGRLLRCCWLHCGVIFGCSWWTPRSAAVTGSPAVLHPFL